MFCYVRRISYAILLGFLWASSAPAEIIQFAATLDGVQADECNGTGSAGTGSGALALDTETGVVSYEITFTGLGSPENAAHVHGPAEACADAGILYGLPSGSPKVDISPPFAAEEQAEQQAKASRRQSREQMEGFRKAFSVCLEAKDYMVKF